MKKLVFILTFTIVFACKNAEPDAVLPHKSDTVSLAQPERAAAERDQEPAQVFRNERFRNVTATKTGNTYEIAGEAQIFEASYSWVIEDGHDELQKGHGMTDAGAPEWGKFNFTVTPEKNRENSTLTLILFEISAKDGSRQHELPIPLL